MTISAIDPRTLTILPVEPVAPVVTLPSTASSIAPAESIKQATFAAPKLEQPRHYMPELIDLHKHMEKTMSKQVSLFDKELDWDLTEIQRLEKEKTTKIMESAKVAANANSWGTLSKVAQYITSAATMVFGIASIATGAAAPMGVLLIASGAMGLAGSILHDTGALQSIAAWFTKSEEMQKKIASRIEMGFFFLSMGLGLGASAIHYSPQILAFTLTKIDTIRKVALGLSCSAWLAKGGIDLRASFLKKEKAHLEASLQNITFRVQELYQHIRERQKEFNQIIHSTHGNTDIVKEAVSLNRASGE